ncbi:MAG: DUF1840 domain-containing protein [Gammaproteobacteria bacterium]|nr:DUF1840 domain-containing protein [Gammaproteobacteria bacterium]
MLVSFQSKNSAAFTMFGDVATQLIKLMGHGGGIPGALAAEDVPAALARLRQALETAPPRAAGTAVDDDDENEPKVSLHQRAAPLIAMLTNAITAESYVMWDK